jgi:hypothetical protein
MITQCNNSAGSFAIQIAVYGSFPQTNKTKAGTVSLLHHDGFLRYIYTNLAPNIRLYDATM